MNENVFVCIEGYIRITGIQFQEHFLIDAKYNLNNTMSALSLCKGFTFVMVINCGYVLSKKAFLQNYQKLHVLYLLLFYQVTGQHIRTFKIVNGKTKKRFGWDGCLDIKVSDALIHILTFYLIVMDDNWVCCEMQMWGLNRQHLSLRFISSPVMHFQSTFYTDDESSAIFPM